MASDFLKRKAAQSRERAGLITPPAPDSRDSSALRTQTEGAVLLPDGARQRKPSPGLDGEDTHAQRSSSFLRQMAARSRAAKSQQSTTPAPPAPQATANITPTALTYQERQLTRAATMTPAERKRLEIEQQWYNAKDAVKTAQAEVDRVQKEADDQTTWVPQRDRAGGIWDTLDNAKKALQKAEGDLAYWSLERYEDRSQRTQRALSEDPAATKQYADAKKVIADQQKLYELIGYRQQGGGGDPEDAARFAQMEEELVRDYGLAPDAVSAYVGGYGTPYSEGLSVQQIMERMDSALAERKTALKEGSDRAAGYDFDDLYGYEQRVEALKRRDEIIENTRKVADEHPVGSSLGTVPLQFLRPADIFTVHGGRGEPGDPDYIPPYNSAGVGDITDTTRGTVAGNIEQYWGDNWFGNTLSFLYSTGMSTVDSAAAVAVMGPSSVYLMGTNAGISNARDIIDRGGTIDQAIAGGVAAGAAEIIFEKFSVDNLLKPRTVSGWKSWVKETLKQGGVEASEEMATEIANILSDTAIMGEKSNFNQAVKAYQGQGMSEEEAKRKAYLDLVGQVALAGAGGVVSGGLMGGSVQGYNLYQYNQQSAEIGRQYSNKDLGRLYQENVAAGQAEAQKTASTGVAKNATIHVGRATTIQCPYDGEVPTYIKPKSQSPIEIDENTLTLAQERVAQAHKQEETTGRSFKGFLRTVYETVFAEDGGQRGVVIEGTRMAGRPYVAMLNKSAVGKVIADVNLSAEKLAIFDALDDVIASGEYVGSGKYIGHGKKTKDTVRFDYFETPVTIGDKPYIVTFDVEVFKNVNNYRTHKVISEIDLTPVGPDSAVTNQPKGTALADTGSDLPQGATEQSLSLKTSIPQTRPGVNLKGRGLGDRVVDAMQKDLKERGRAEEESKSLRERLAQVQAEGEAGLAQTRTQYEKAVADRETGMTQEQTADAERGIKDDTQASELGDKARHVGKSIALVGQTTGFDGLTRTLQQSFKDGLKTAAPEVRQQLRQWKRKAQYRIKLTKHSRYSPDTGVITLGRDATHSTIAHELFHWVDHGGKISSQLLEPLMQDCVALNMAGRGDVKRYLTEKYPEAFSRRSKSGEQLMGEAYRGISDILNGLSEGKVWYGYGHPGSYWAKSGMLEAEAWAQLGRVLYNNEAEALKMFGELFPNFLRSAILALKELI